MKKILSKLCVFSSSWTGTLIIVFLIIFFVAQAFIIPSASMQNSLLIGDFLFAKKFSYGIATPRIPFTNTPILPDFQGNGHLIEGDRPKRGEIVIFLNPLDNKENFVKRCFAVGGDEIVYKDDAFYLHHNEGDEYIKANYPADRIYTFLGKLWVENPYMEEYGGINYKNVSSDENLIFKNIIYSSDNPSPFVLMSRVLISKGVSYIGMEPINIAGFTTYSKLNFNAFYAKVKEDSFFMIGDNRDSSSDSRFFGDISYSLIVGKPWFIYFSWDKNKVPRWDRVGSFVDTVEKKINPKWID